MLLLVHKFASWILKRRISQIESFLYHPHEVQEAHFEMLIERAVSTSWGKEYGYADIDTLAKFRERVPISNYEKLYPWIERTLKGEADVLWPGQILWFSKSSGTTNDKSKYIPVTEDALEGCHFKAGQDMLALYFSEQPESKLFTGKALSIGGSHNVSHFNPQAHIGDVSAVITENLPRFFELMRAPSKEVALMADWEPKIEAMAEEIMHEDITSIAGVPTWTLVLIRRVFEKRGITSGNLLDVWPNLELFLHGGVNFDPYRQQFMDLIPSPQMTYLDVYNASEGFFAVQNELNSLDMLLMLDHGIFYEFIPVEELGRDHPKTHVLGEVELGRSYAIVISTNAGLWRYMVGDTVMFTSLDPYKIKVTGRTKQFINAFGEELVVENAERAITAACEATGAIVCDYTAAPIYFKEGEKGGHEWLIEFEKQPHNLEQFREVLDQTLKQVNSDYEAKRTMDIALAPPLIHVLSTGTFHHWMKLRGKLGGQHKVPRLANDRLYLEEILQLGVNSQ
jgi:hypothetical protein